MPRTHVLFDAAAYLVKLSAHLMSRYGKWVSRRAKLSYKKDASRRGKTISRRAKFISQFVNECCQLARALSSRRRRC